LFTPPNAAADNRVFMRSYPIHEPTRLTPLSTPERTGALPHFTGQGVVMAFIDSGFYPHPDLNGRILTYADATYEHVTEGKRFDWPRWYSWHGQMTSVIAAGDGRTSNGKYRGIASGAQLVLIKVSNARRQIKEADILRGMGWLIDNAARLNVRVLNVSVGGDFPSNDPDHPLHRAVRMLVEGGVTVLISAGNSGIARIVPPASAPDAITIGGVDDQNALDVGLWQSYPNSYGTSYDGTIKPDVTTAARWIVSPILPGSSVEREARWLAPMLDLPVQDDTVQSLIRDGYRDLKISRKVALNLTPALHNLLQDRLNEHKLVDAHHQHVDGTSVSSAIAASIVAQMLEANPRLTPTDIKTILTGTAKLLPGVPREQQGAGVIDASAAVTAALS
jgi:serine protease AprX